MSGDYANFWDVDYLNAFRLLFQRSERVPKQVLLDVLRSVPAQRGHAHYIEVFEGDRMIALFTNDMDDDTARSNQAWILTPLAETRAIEFFGTEGASGGFTFDKYRALSDRKFLEAYAHGMFRDFYLSPIEYVALICTEPVFVWGIEDAELYHLAMKAYRGKGGSYGEIIRRRPQILLSNLLAKMEEMNVTAAGVWLTPYNFDAVHSLLRQRRISHVGIRARAKRGSSTGRVDKLLRGKNWNAGEEFIQQFLTGRLEGLTGWVRSLSRGRTATRHLEIDGQTIVYRFTKVYEFERVLKRAVRWLLTPLLRGLESIRPFPTTLRRLAARQDIDLIDEQCDVCGQRMCVPVTALTFPLQVRPAAIDTGGYCESCEQWLCPRHLSVAATREGITRCSVACASCGVPVTGASTPDGVTTVRMGEHILPHFAPPKATGEMRITTIRRGR